jgi:biofilm PGA synthesis N-glycosyltransferase PgaC
MTSLGAYMVNTLTSGLFSFVFYYPLFMAYVWITGSLYYFLHYERKDHRRRGKALLQSSPPVSILVPCYNEEETLREVIDHLLAMNYPDYEVIAVNDGSTDRTGQILDELAAQHPRLRVIHHAQNQGKAAGLNTAALLAAHDFLIGIDGDALLDHDAIPWLLRHFESGPRVGAVTGNPRIRTRSTLLGRLQVGEFSSIIGLIKRAQRTYGRLFTVSGVIAAFRRTALLDVGFWSHDILTEDIDVSWKLQLRHWDVRFEPHALCWILMPETLHGLWRQRLRWAMGGVQVMLKNLWILKSWRQRRMWPIFLEYFISVTWAYAISLVFILWFLGLFVPMPHALRVETVLPTWYGVLIGTTCLLQILVSMLVDRRYDQRLLKYYYWMIWYPLAYWMINVATTVVALFKVLVRERGKRARWTSPDRGLQTCN